MLEAREVTVRIGARRLLDGVSAGVRPGEVLAVLGPNGAGKSTLLRLLTGEWRPHGGEVLLEGEPLARWKPLELARRRAVLPQDAALAFPFSVLDVVMLGRSPHVRVRETPRDEEIVREVLRAVDMEALAERSYLTLSGGERQRVQLARALAQVWEAGAASRFLLLDEPTASLDLSHQHGTLALARRLANDGVGVLAVLHDLNLAARYADRVLLLDAGRYVCDGTPAEVLSAERIAAVFDVATSILREPESGVPVVVTTSRTVSPAKACSASPPASVSRAPR